jgi:N-acetyl-gamma-glutamyl-phosphate reductase
MARVAATIFIDGQAGTTGLRIRELLAGRRDLELIEVDPARRKDPAARRECLAAADVALLCLPDDAAREAVALVADRKTRVLDASTAHRVADGWVYGLPELARGQREAIAGARRVSNPGCYPTCTSLLLRPLVDADLLAPSTPLAIHALSGYSGGGRAKIERWQDPAQGLEHLPYEALYALDRVHKHVPEMTRHARLAAEPQFAPAVGPFECGMRVQIPLHAQLLGGVSGKQLHEALAARYAHERFVRVLPIAEPLGEDERSFDPEACNGTNRIDLHVVPNPAGHVLLIAIVDNLGKGAAGAAVQNLNLMLDLPEDAGLRER